jgi:calcium-dependent protein kinase
VYKAKHKASKRIVAIKILEKENISSNEINMIKNEIDILKICQHPNIVKLYDVFEDIDRIHIIMELIEGPDLFCYLEKKDFDINESEANKSINKLSSAIYYLNVFGIVHRDIKPENILLTDNSNNYDIKLIDFGLGIILGPDEKSEQPFGTVSYVSPEVLCGNDYDKSVDIWSMGILSYLLLVGRLPFDHPDDDENEIARQTINDPVPFTEKKWNKISCEAKDFVNQCLKKDPLERINITEILKHAWIKKYISEEQKNKENDLETLSSHEVFKILCPNAFDECEK